MLASEPTPADENRAERFVAEEEGYRLGYLAFAISRHPRLIILGTCLGLSLCLVWHVFSPADYRSEALISIGNSALGIGVITNATRAEKQRLIKELMQPEVIELAGRKMGLTGDFDEIHRRYIHRIEFAFRTHQRTNHSMKIGVNHRTRRTLYKWSQHHLEAYLETHDIPKYTATYMGLTRIDEANTPSRVFIVVSALLSFTLGFLTPAAHVKLEKRRRSHESALPNEKSIPNPASDSS